MDGEGKPPHNLKKRTLAGSNKCFFTCGRPGYCARDKSRQVSDNEVSAWACGLLGLPGPKKAIVSLLGRKPDGKSEFRFYTFHGEWDTSEERGGKPSFQEWMDNRHADLDIMIREYPTYDKGLSSEEVKAIAAIICDLFAQGRTVIVVDSAGASRTQQVANYFRS